VQGQCPSDGAARIGTASAPFTHRLGAT